MKLNSLKSVLLILFVLFFLTMLVPVARASELDNAPIYSSDSNIIESPAPSQPMLIGFWLALIYPEYTDIHLWYRIYDAPTGGGSSTTTAHYVHTDHLTGSNVVTDEDGELVELMDYFPFGGIRFDQKAGSFDEQRKFAGSEYDADTGMNYLGARYYNASLNRLLSQDPGFINLDPDYIVDPQQWNSYSYARNNPLGYVDPDGKKVELVSRPVVSYYNHLFYLITPDNPGEINIDGIPQGTESFTIGGYNRGGFLGIGNKLTPEFGYVGGPQNSDSKYLLGESKPTASVTITPPDGVTDSQLINSLGTTANSIEPVSYFSYGQTGRSGNANSNNFVYEIGSRVGVGDQVKSFTPENVVTPGKNQGLPTSSIRQDIQRAFNQVKQQLTGLGNKIGSLFSRDKE